MPTMILKSTPESEKYVLWSTIVDAPVGYETRETLQNSPKSHDYPDERFERTDRTGTSLHDGAYGWTSEYRSMIVTNLGTNHEFYLLHLDNLESFMDALWTIEDEDKEGEQKVLDEFCTLIEDDE